MPAIRPPAKVLVTGSNGYIGTWIVRTLFDRGFSVRAAVRAESKTTYFRQLFKGEVDQDKLEFAIVPDIITPGAFDEAVKGVDAIIHAASPTHLEADDPDGTMNPQSLMNAEPIYSQRIVSEQIIPAREGTLNILKSALSQTLVSPSGFTYLLEPDR